LDQIFDQPADRTATDPHEPREVRARDRLSRSHEVERDLPVDLTRRSPASDPERRGTDSTHGLPADRSLGGYGLEWNKLWPRIEQGNFGDTRVGSSRAPVRPLEIRPGRACGFLRAVCGRRRAAASARLLNGVECRAYAVVTASARGGQLDHERHARR